MATDLAIAEARAEADAARERLVGTAQALAAALAPKRLAAVAWDNAKDKGADLAEDAVDAVKRRPGLFGGALAAVALFLAREPLIDAARGLKERWSEDDEPAAPPAPKVTPKPAAKATAKDKPKATRAAPPRAPRRARTVKG